MNFAEIISAISMTIFLLTVSALGSYYLIQEINENKYLKKEADFASKFYSAKSRKMLIKAVIRPEEYQLFDEVNGEKYDIYLPDTNYKVGDSIRIKFAPGIIFYKLEK